MLVHMYEFLLCTCYQFYFDMQKKYLRDDMEELLKYIVQSG